MKTIITLKKTDGPIFSSETLDIHESGSDWVIVWTATYNQNRGPSEPVTHTWWLPVDRTPRFVVNRRVEAQYTVLEHALEHARRSLARSIQFGESINERRQIGVWWMANRVGPDDEKPKFDWDPIWEVGGPEFDELVQVGEVTSECR